MPLTKSVIDILNDESRLVNQLYHVFRMIHLTVTICHSSKIQACHRLAECCWFKTLSVPQCLHDKEARILRHGFLGTGKNAYNLFFRKTIQELTHPYRIQAISTRRKRGLGIQQVNAIAFYSIGSFPTLYILSHHLYLLRQVKNRDVYILVIRNTLQSSLACIPANVIKGTGGVLSKNYFQRLRKGGIAIEMVKAKPTLLNLFGKA